MYTLTGEMTLKHFFLHMYHSVSNTHLHFNIIYEFIYCIVQCKQHLGKQSKHHQKYHAQGEGGAIDKFHLSEH